VWHLRHANPNQKRINPRLGKAKDNSTKYPTKGEKSQKVGYRADASECSHNNVRSRLTSQAQRPGARDATIATATLTPGSLERESV